MAEPLPKVYESKDVEVAWLKRWLARGLYHAQVDSERPPFSIVIPPPNVTGVLHMGHALNNTLQDILCRYKRMNGFSVLWMPGTDHAGIATQNVVEKKLAAEGKGRHDLGREEFIKEVWKWKEKHGDHIIHQLQRLGASCDWDRERFTMDEGLSEAVRNVFVSLYDKGLIYRDLYLINWCPRCHTALSDIEVEHEEQKGHLWHIRYPVKVGAGLKPAPTEIIVATTRPETMLGDTAVAVHPEDERYRDLVGQSVILPLVEREIPIIADHRVDREFGTGAVKITPAHDFNDYILGKEHELEQINVLNEDATMNENAIHFKGLDRYECRRRIVDELEEKGFLVKIEDHNLSVGNCYRCKTVVEPYLSLQWFVKTQPLAERALQAVRDGRTTFHPANWTKTYEQWMENIQPWCISRQIWWGHQIPAWYCRRSQVSGFRSQENAGHSEPEAKNLPATDSCPPIVAKVKPDKCPHCGDTELVQDPDVLDTWFSSALWPFSTMGWPEQTPELKKFYPTSVLITAFDIIFFWVARMMMMGLEFMDEVPFKDVYIHAIVRDAEGKKMSKSKGNVIDPLEIMDKFGTDAFRFTLAALAVQGRDIKLSEDVIQGYRNFCNKIWNASRYVLMTLGDYQPNQTSEVYDLSDYDYWILNKLKQTIETVSQAIEEYKFDVAAKAAYQFFWRDFCDWYLEFSKGTLTKPVLYQTLNLSLRMLHPFMPFITEEIWHKLPGAIGDQSIEELSYPKPEDTKLGFGEKEDQYALEILDLVRSAIESARSIRGETGINPSENIKLMILARRPEDRVHYQKYKDDIERLTRASVTLIEDIPTEKGLARGVISDDLQVFVDLKGLVDLEAEKARLEKELGNLQKEEQRLAKKLSNKNFVDRAPPEVIESDREKLALAQAKIVQLREAQERLS